MESRADESLRKDRKAGPLSAILAPVPDIGLGSTIQGTKLIRTR